MQPGRKNCTKQTQPDARVVRLPVSFRPTSVEGRQAAHIAAFANHRRLPDDVYWLKEVAECLGILTACDARPGAAALEPLHSYYEGLEAHCSFYPQYYRFHLGIALDLEALGMPGDVGARIARFVEAENLAGHELSDLQRAEAARLLERAGHAPQGVDDLRQRLHHFAARARHFAVPNKKAAYELTHIVFYLSDYGRRDPQLGDAARQSLMHLGLLAYLEQNADLLAEVAIALRYVGAPVPPLWAEWLGNAWAGFAALPGEGAQDSYHEYVVLAWSAAVLTGQPVLDRPIPEGGVNFYPTHDDTAPLRTMSRLLSELPPGQRSGDWSLVRPRMLDQLDDIGRSVIEAAEQSTDDFDSFFEGFARAGVDLERCG